MTCRASTTEESVSMADGDLSRPAVDLREDGGIWWITFNRPEASNAFTLADLDRLFQIFDEAGDRPQAAVLTGAGRKSFSAGMHLKAFSELTPERARNSSSRTEKFSPPFGRHPFLLLPPSMGIAWEPVWGWRWSRHSNCRPPRHLRAPEIKVGVPSVCDIALLQQHIGLSKAKEVILTGDSYPVEQLLPYGFLNAVVPADELIVETKRMLGRLVRHTRTVVAAQKKLFETWQNTTLTAGIDMSVEVFASVFASPDTYEQIANHQETIGRKTS
jgi:enoyl-CoA hydratase/carnithine racemase